MPRTKKVKVKTEIVVLQDRSGSMWSIKDDMVGGFMNFIKEQKKVDAPCTVSLYQFDNEFETVYENMPLVEVNELVLEPRGGTALLDALGKTVTLVKERHAKMSKSKKPEQVVLVVLTDGQENSSREFTKDAVSKLVKQVQVNECGECGSTKDGWQVVFLGANIDSFAEASSLGISTSMIANFTADSAGTEAVYDTMSSTIGAYRSRSASSVNLNAHKDKKGFLKKN